MRCDEVLESCDEVERSARPSAGLRRLIIISKIFLKKTKFSKHKKFEISEKMFDFQKFSQEVMR